jgi:hypothetical protein
MFLDKTCGDDAALREEVESLLRAHEQAGSFAEHAAADGLAGRPLQRDDCLGSYEIIELLGAGSGCSATLPRRSATRFRRVAHHRGQIARESSGGIGTNRCAIWWSISADRHARPSRPVRRVRRRSRDYRWS